MIPLKIYAIISPSGQLVFKNSELLKEWLRHNSDQEVQITLEKPKKAKTPEQLGYLFAHVVPAIAEFTGYSDDEAYGILKRYGKESGEPYEVSLSSLGKADVSKFIAQVVEFGQTLGAEIYPSDHYGG